jgi:hypothetical protein
MQTHSERFHCASEWPCGASTQALNSGTVRGRRSPRVSGSVQPWPRCLVAATVARAGANARAATADAACPRPSRLRGHSISRGRSGAGRASGCASPVRIAQPGHASSRGTAAAVQSLVWQRKGAPVEKFQLQKTQREKKNAHKWTCRSIKCPCKCWPNFSGHSPLFRAWRCVVGGSAPRCSSYRVQSF